ncbi:MAG: DAK2 domain-containing protein [Gaiellaceae bacterium]
MSGLETDLSTTRSELVLLRRFAHTALKALERDRQRIDGLNVYPVPDGDTGANLVSTVRALVDELDATEPVERSLLHRNLARALRMGARGNSGVILSQLVAGAVQAAPVASAIDGRALALMLESAREAAYAAVSKPVEGTMLTLMGALSERALALRRKKLPLDQLLRRLVESGEEALARTPDQLPALREAGVVDAGAAGLLECLRAIAAAVSAEPAVEAAQVLRLVTAPPGV